MANLTVANYLGALQEDPYEQGAYAGLKDALASGDPARVGEDHVRHLEFARRNHEVRGEAYAAAHLIEIQLGQDESDPDFASALWKELGRLKREELMDDAGARAAYERALALRPGDEEVISALEQIQQTAERWKELAAHFKAQAREASDAPLKTSLLVRAATIVWQYQRRGRNKEVDKLFKEALRTDDTSARAVRLYEITLRAREKWEDLGKVLCQAMTQVPGRDDRLGIALGCARLYSRVLQSQEKAAECYQQVLDYAPGNDEALSFMATYFTERELWDYLVALYEDALRSRQLRPDAETGMLLQIAMVHWRMRGAADKAEPYFAKLRKSAPAQPVMLDFYREMLAGTENQGKLLTILADAQRSASSDGERLKVALDLARLASGQEGATERAIDAYKTVLRYEPANEEAASALKDLYRRAGKWNALVEVLRGEFEAVDPSDKTRRLLLLRDLLPVYRDELKLDVMVLNTYNTILQEDPTDTEAIGQLAQTYESMGRWNDLIPVLQRKAEATQEPEEKVDLLMRVAGMWIEHFSNYNQATAPLEQVLELAPDQREALSQLKEIYSKKRAWRPLIGVMSREAALIEDPAEKRPVLVDLAKLAAERTQDYAEAIRLWKQALEIDADDTQGIETLEKLAERAKDWSTLAEALERRIDRETDEKARIKLLTRLGSVLGERAKDPAAAAGAWQRILHMDPKNGRALRTLRESFLAARDWEGLEAMYLEANDWEGLVDVLGNVADRAEDDETRLLLSFRAAEIYENELAAPQRAFRAYERVLAVDPTNQRAARALLPIYRSDDKWPKVVGLLEVLVQGLDEGEVEARLAYLGELIDVSMERLRDGERAYLHAVDAYELAPEDPAVVERLERAVELSGNYEGLLGVYTRHAKQASGERAVYLRREAARIAADRLGQPNEAARLLEQILQESPEDQEASRILEGIYRAMGRLEDLRELLGNRMTRTEGAEERRAMLADLALLEEDLLEDPDAAAQRYRDMLELDSGDTVALSALDRLAMSAGRHGELASVLEKRIEVAADLEEQLGLTLRLGGLRMDRLDDQTGAIQSFASVLELAPGQASAVQALETIASRHDERSVDVGRLLEEVYAERGEFGKLSGVLETRLASCHDEDEKHALRLRLAEVAGTLGNPEGAYRTLEAALLDSPTDRDLWDRLAAVAEQAGMHEALAEAYSVVLEEESQDEDGVSELSRRTARLYYEVLGQPEKAEPFHLRVLSLEPEASRPFEALKEFYTNAEHWDQLKALYRTRIAVTHDGDQKLDLLLQVCFLFEELIDDVGGAIQAYREVLELEPAHATSRRALERLYTRAERWRDLTELLDGDLAEAEGKEAIELMQRLGELHEQKLDEPGLAVDRYSSVLEAQPTHMRAQEALERMLVAASQRQRIALLLEPLYDAQGAYSELVKVLEVQLEELEDPGARVAVLLRVAQLLGTYQRDADGAFAALLRALKEDPKDTNLREQLAEVARQAGRERDRAQALEEALEVTTDSFARVEILAELAELWDVQLNDPGLAEQTYARLIAEDSENAEVVLPAARALERLHLLAENYPALAQDLRRQADLEDDHELKRSLLVRLAELTELNLGDTAGAIEVHRERLEVEPSDQDAMLQLSRLYENGEQWESLIGVLRTRDQVAQDEEEARSYVRRAGEIYETRLGDGDSAIAAYNDVLSRFGPDRETLGRLCALYEQREQWQDLLDTVLLELDVVDDPRERANVRFRAAELMRTRTCAVEEAVQAYREILEEDPEHEGSIAALREVATTGSEVRVLAAQTLVPYSERAADHDGLVRMLEVVADTDDVPEALSALRRAAQVAELQLEDPGRAFGILCRAVRLALGEPDLAEFLDHLHELAQQSGRFGVYGSLLREIAPDILDEDRQLTCLMRVAEVARDHDGDPAVAREYFGKVLEIRPEHRAGLDALQALYEAVNDHRGLLEVLRRKVDVVDDPSERVDLLLRQARLCADQLDDVDAAIAAYERVLEELPSSDVFAGLEALYLRASRFGELSQMYERQLDADIGDVVRVRYCLGELYRGELNDAERALEYFRDVLEREPSHPGTSDALQKMIHHETLRGAVAELLEPLFLRRQDWPNLIVALEAQLENLFSAEDRRPLLMRLAELNEVQLEDLDSALEVHARMFRDDPSDVDAIETLERLARVLDRRERVAEVFEAELEERGVADEAHVALAVRAAEIRDQASNDPEKATLLYQRALEFDPQRTDIAHALEELLRRRGAHHELAQLYRAQADIAEMDERRVMMLHRLAELTEHELSDADGAVTLLKEVLGLAREDSQAVAGLDRLLVQLSRWDDVADHLRHCIDIAADPGQALELKIRLGGVLYEHLEDVDAAIDLLEEITQVDPHYAPALQTLEGLMDQPRLRPRISDILQGLYATSGEWTKQVRVLERRLEIEQDPAERIHLLGEIAQQYEHAGQNSRAAFDAWARAFELAPSDEHPRGEAERLAEHLGDWDALVKAYEKALAAAAADYVQTSLLGAMARVHDEKRGDPRAAIATYERLLTLESDDPAPLEHLEALHTMVGDWRGLVDVTQRKLERAFDPVERAELARRAGSVLEELLMDVPAAIEAYRNALQEQEDDMVSLEALDRLHTQAEDWESLASVLQQRMQFETETEARVDVAMRLGEVLATRLVRRQDAIEAYGRALEDQPDHGEACTALGRLYEQEEMWSELLDNLRQRSELAIEADDRVALLFQAGNVLQEKLNDSFEAIQTLNRVLEAQPQHEGAIHALMAIGQQADYRAQVDEVLEPLLREHGRWDELGELMARSAASVSDPFEKQQILMRLAGVHEQGRQDLSAAFDTYCEALLQDAEEPQLADDVERLAAALSAADRAADVFAQRANATTDDTVARDLLWRQARLAERDLSDIPRAIAALVQALERTGDDAECLAELDRLYTTLESWPDLGGILERRVGMAADDREGADFLVRLGELRELRFEEFGGALAAYRDALERAPLDPRAVSALERLLPHDDLAHDIVEILDGVYRQSGDMTRVASLYDTRVRLADTAGEKVSLLQELAGMWESDLGKPEHALSALRQAFELDPVDLGTVEELERVALAGAGFEPLRGLVESIRDKGELDRNERRDLSLRAARWYGGYLDDPEAAELNLRAALEADPESSEAHEGLVALLREADRTEALIAALTAWAEQESDVEVAKSRLYEAANLARQRDDIETAIEKYKRIYAIDPGATDALDELIHIREAQEAWSQVAELLEHRVEAEMDADVRVELRHRAARVQRHLGEDTAAAERLYQANLEDSPTDLESMDALGGLYEDTERWEDLAELLQRRLDVVDTVEERVTVRVRLASLSERQFGQRDQAIEQLNEVLMDVPTHPEALDTLERLLSAAERWEEVSDLLERRVEAAEREGDVVLELDLKVRRGDLFEKSLGDADRAVDMFRSVLERDPSHVGALRSLVRLHVAAGEVDQGVETLEQLMERVEGEELVDCAFQLAEMAEEQLEAPDRAEAALRRALQAGVRADEIRQRLAAHFQKHKRFADLAEILLEDVDALQDATAKVDLLRRISRIYADELADPARAAEALERAGELVPDDRDVLLPLCDLYIDAGRQQDAVPVLEKIIASYSGRRSREVATFHHRLGRAYMGMGDGEAALKEFDAAFRIDLTNVAILVDLGVLCHQRGDLERAQKTFRALLLQKLDDKAPVTKADVYFYLGDIASQLGDKLKAVSMLERALAEQKDHDRAGQLLGALKG